MEGNEFGDRIRYLRKIKKMTQRGLAKKANKIAKNTTIPITTITNWENRKVLDFFEKLKAVSAALDMTLPELFEFEDTNRESTKKVNELTPNALNFATRYSNLSEDLRRSLSLFIDYLEYRSVKPTDKKRK